ncbi:MAG: DUF885 family protein [Acidobacteriota bacterium]|nr:DUF885 family protein [Acidobacteriota bacterium]
MERYAADRGNILRFYNIAASPARRARLRQFYEETKAALAAQNFDAMSQDGKVDYILFRNNLDHELRRLDLDEKQQAEDAPYLPFAGTIVDLEEARQKMTPLDPVKAAQTLEKLSRDIAAAHQSVDAKLRAETGFQATQTHRIVGNRAAAEAAALRNALRTWFTFYDGYDPMFTWWAEEAYRTVDASLANYANYLRERVAGLKPEQADAAGAAGGGGRGAGRGGASSGGANAAPMNAYNAAIAGARAGSTDDIVGDPIGREGLMSELAYEMIPYTPEQLIAIANREFAWCEAEMKKASREMGFGDDWRAALEKVKNMYVEPGKQPQMIRDLALEAEKFLDDHDLVTVPPLARETWRMDMMTPARQLVNPFFTGGETISVSYPVNSMTYEQKMMSMRGNNIPMSRATVFHELIPGHNLQGYYAARYKAYRSIAGGTPFVTEGWSLYWELLMWDLKFQKTPEDRVGALFWHMHRCARIIFSLSFHLGRMTPAEAVNMLVERVGFERENAVGEVRRSFSGAYSPLYQAAYLLGGMQLKALHDRMVGPGKWTNRQFNDAVLKENRIPIELIRASLTSQKLTRDYQSSWKFYGDVEPAN